MGGGQGLGQEAHRGGEHADRVEHPAQHRDGVGKGEDEGEGVAALEQGHAQAEHGEHQAAAGAGQEADEGGAPVVHREVEDEVAESQEQGRDDGDLAHGADGAAQDELPPPHRADHDVLDHAHPVVVHVQLHRFHLEVVDDPPAQGAQHDDADDVAVMGEGAGEQGHAEEQHQRPEGHVEQPEQVAPGAHQDVVGVGQDPLAGED